MTALSYPLDHYGPPTWHNSDREFSIILLLCILGYVLLVTALLLIQPPTVSEPDITTLPPRIAKLILEAPPTPRPPPSPPPAVPEVRRPAPEAPPPAPKIAPTPVTPPQPVPSKPEPEVPTAEELAKAEQARQEAARIKLEAEAAAKRERDRAVARQSGLLKAFTTDSGGGTPGVEDSNLDHVLSDISVLTNPTRSPQGTKERGIPNLGPGTGTGQVTGSGTLRVDDVVQGLRGEGTGEAIILARTSAAPIESSLVVKGIDPTRSDVSIRKLLKALDPWLKFQYHKAQRAEPAIGDQIAVEFTITPTGDVIDCRVASSNLNHAPLEAAILKRFCLLKFPPLAEGATDEVTTKYFVDFEGFS